MKKLYPFTTLLLSALSFSYLSQAQTYANTYTAINTANWHVTSGPNAWDPNGEPPSHCSNCQIIINAGVTVSLNTSVTLDQGSVLQIGTDDGTATALRILGSSGTDWASSYNVILMNDGSAASSITIANSSSLVNAASANQQFDGVFTTAGSSPVTYYRQVGTGPSSYQGTTVTNNRTFSNNSQTGPISLSSNGTLPVSLTDLEAVLTDGKVNITWTTQMEVNSNYFSVLRSTDGGASWKSIGTVAAHGNSSISLNYSFTDETPGAGVSEYRLEAFDKDGKSALTQVVIVRNGLVGNVSFFPNPAKDFVYIAIPEATTGNLSVRLFSQSGQLLTERSLSNAGGSTVSLPVSNYPQGNYVLIVTTQDGSKQVSKLVISK